MGLKVDLHRRAEQDLQEIQNYLVQQAGAQAAEHVRLHLLGKIRRLANTPRMGRLTTKCRHSYLAADALPISRLLRRCA
jgi:plasmid stabilization system protein ParE